MEPKNNNSSLRKALSLQIIKILELKTSKKKEKKGELKASLVSSKNLSPEELNNLNKEISQVVGTSVSFDYKVDESLIGGLQMQLGSLMVDTSIKNKLKKYQQIMLEV